MSNGRRVRLPRKLKLAFRAYLEHGDEATEAVAVIAQAIRDRDRQQRDARDGR